MADGQGEAAWGMSVQVIIGMLECWNTGILGSGKMESWVIVRFLLTGIKYRNFIFFKSSLHYSIIPLFHIRIKNISLKNNHYSQ